MSDVDRFAKECREASRGLRRVPATLRRELAQTARDEVARPLAARIATAAPSSVLAAGTKARAAADPQVVVGGTRPRLSGGAGPRDLVFGTEFGGGKKVTAVPATGRRRGYRRRSTRQFTKRPFVFPTIARNIEWVLDTYADATLATIDKELSNG